jgi:hypothetical protein
MEDSHETEEYEAKLKELNEVFNPMKYMSPEDMAKMGAAGGMPGMDGVPGMSGMAPEAKVKVEEVD